MYYYVISHGEWSDCVEHWYYSHIKYSEAELNAIVKKAKELYIEKGRADDPNFFFSDYGFIDSDVFVETLTHASLFPVRSSASVFYGYRGIEEL